MGRVSPQLACDGSAITLIRPGLLLLRQVALIPPGQSGQVTVKVNTSHLTPGNYVGQITLNGMDAKGNPAPGSPQTMIVNLVMQSPCTLSPPSSSALSFSAVQGASANPATQTVLFTGNRQLCLAAHLEHLCCTCSKLVDANRIEWLHWWHRTIGQ